MPGWRMGRSRCRSALVPFDLAFHPQALRSKLRGSSNRYKIKLRAAGFRLIDEVRDQQLLVLVLTVGKRDLNAAYHHADQRLMFSRQREKRRNPRTQKV